MSRVLSCFASTWYATPRFMRSVCRRHGRPEGKTATQNKRRPGSFLHSIRQDSFPMFCDFVSGPEILLLGRISAGVWTGRPQNRSSDRPSAGQRADLEALPGTIRFKSGPEAGFPARKHNCSVICWAPGLDSLCARPVRSPSGPAPFEVHWVAE